MEQFNRFGIDNTNQDYIDTSMYGMACVYALIEREIENYLKQFNMSASKFNMLMIIKHQGGDIGISQIDVGKKLIVTASNMTKQLDKFDNEGLIERFSQKGDRRVNLVKITQKGSDLLDEVWPGYHEKITQLASMLTIDERETLSMILAKWFENLEKK